MTVALDAAAEAVPKGHGEVVSVGAGKDKGSGSVPIETSEAVEEYAFAVKGCGWVSRCSGGVNDGAVDTGWIECAKGGEVGVDRNFGVEDKAGNAHS
jgi:hypothetical protein